jgi:hypothetical protein
MLPYRFLFPQMNVLLRECRLHSLEEVQTAAMEALKQVMEGKKPARVLPSPTLAEACDKEGFTLLFCRWSQHCKVQK